MVDAKNLSKSLSRYAAVAASLFLLAIISFLVTPQGISTTSCSRLIIQNSKYICFSALALATTNASVCSYIKAGNSDSCYSQVAAKSNNSATCASIINSSIRNSCIIGIAIAKLSFSTCGTASEPYGSRCTEEVALKTSNLTLCGSVRNSTYRLFCTSEINTEYAITKNSPSFCANVTNSTNKNLTSYILLNFTSTYNPAAYQNVSIYSSSLEFLPNTTYTPRDYCYTTLASQLGSNALCSKVSAGESRNLCFLQTIRYPSLANATANYTAQLAACNNAGSYAQQCIQSLELAQAIKTRNTTICGRLPGTQAGTCFSLLADTYSNSTYCNYITNATQKSSCISTS